MTKSDLEENTTIVQDLKNKVDELTLHNDYQLRLKDMNYNEKIKEVTEKFTEELNQDRKKHVAPLLSTALTRSANRLVTAVTLNFDGAWF